jgi:hypothetical protein
VPAGVFYADRRGIKGIKQQLQLLFQPEEMAPSLSPEVKARAIELLSLLLRKTLQKEPSITKEQNNERQNSANPPRT